ncbi:hypothetical protein [Tsuneonella aeria]|uniref:hypothetical protein n=1 Tax=Tsuneonella aeria TaxID=1837929 RepID=UPI00192936DB|nr:hypothetical protein [Tsuneonella aeria]
MGGEVWTLVVIGGPILLIAIVIWAFLRNRSAGRGTAARAERGAVELREDIERGTPPPR